MDLEITPELLVRAYASGIFPMASPEEEGEIFWLSPDPRAILPLDGLRIPRSVARLLRSGEFVTTADSDFGAVIRACADREETWISPKMQSLYESLHERGIAHSIEVWSGETLAGGLYGLALGGAFFGESMFSEKSNASKVGLVDLVARLRKGAFRLLDTQYLTPHLERFGAVEIDRSQFLRRLDEALAAPATWIVDPGPIQ